METVAVALTPKILFTIIALASCFGPMIADFNKTHATNPLWTPHARFHVVWQVLTQAGVATVVLYLIWMPDNQQMMHLYLAAILNYVWGGSFFLTLATMPVFDGSLKDVNGIKPFRFNFFGNIWLVDTNLFGCTILMILNTLGLYLLITS